MRIAIINIGDELLIGQVVNTNAAWMAEQLNLSGFSVCQITVTGDTREQILMALEEAEKCAEVVLISGGIGPTPDDITKRTLCEYFNTTLVFNDEAYRDIERFFASRGMGVTELNRKQADLPEHCASVPNKNGTARGMWFEKEVSGNRKVIFISMPGVPFEMKAMMTDEIIPRLKKQYKPQAIYHKTILTQGIGESFLAKIIGNWEQNLPENIHLAYLPQPGIVRLRLTGTGTTEKEIKKLVYREALKLRSIIPEYIYGYDDERLEEIIGKLLTERSQTLSTAESCTGGYIAHLITSIPGSSIYFKGGVIAYANEIKESELGVSREKINLYGAVSEEVAREMATGIQHKFHSDYALATSGIAGPTGGTGEKPVGTTWIAIASPGSVSTEKFLFGDDRERNIRRTALQALNMLRKKILSGLT